MCRRSPTSRRWTRAPDEQRNGEIPGPQRHGDRVAVGILTVEITVRSQREIMRHAEQIESPFSAASLLAIDHKCGHAVKFCTVV